jgi:hypothetical protein
MQVIEEKIKIYQAKDGTKFKDKGECYNVKITVTSKKEATPY